MLKVRVPAVIGYLLGRIYPRAIFFPIRRQRQKFRGRHFNQRHRLPAFGDYGFIHYFIHS